jgi:peptide/nickel transport system substrate-binding protein/oligopeptide transport system substrate-binding protein
VRHSFERLLLHPTSEVGWLYSSLRGARALLAGEARDLVGFRIHSASEFTIELEEPVSFFPALLAFGAAAIVPEGSDPRARSWQEGCVGTGPYRVVAFEPGRRLELEANRTYWRKGYPRNEGIVFTIGVSSKEILAGFRDGHFALASDLLPADVDALRREPDFAAGYREAPRLVTYYVVFNTHRGPLSDPGLRHRLVQAVDVPRLVQRHLGRLAIPAYGLIPPGLPGYDPGRRPRGEASTPPEPAPLAALELRAVANPVFFGGHAAVAHDLQAAFADKGVKLTFVNTTMAEYEEGESRGTVDLSLGRWTADYPDADTFVHLLHSREGVFGRMCGTPELDRLVERGRSEMAPSARHSIYRQVEEAIARDALLLPLFHEQAYRFVRPEVEGLTVSLWGQTVAYEDLRIRG